MEGNGQDVRCRDCCSTRAKDWYWYNTNGKRLKEPRCSICHERQVRLETQQKVYSTIYSSEDILAQF